MEMICPGCGSAETRTITSRPVGALVMRGKRCEACDGEWGTQECVIQGSFIRRSALATGSHPRPPEATGGQGSVLGSGSLTLIPDPDPPPQISEKAERYGPEFVRFWDAYPRKDAKAAAQRAWKRHRPPLDRCLEALKWQRLTRQWRVDKIIPHAATWLNQHRWEDDPIGAGRVPIAAPYHAPAPEPTYNRPAPWPDKEAK